MDKQNILLILCDQFRWDCLSIAGHPTVDTPNLDTLASDGVRFINAYSPSPSCVPARASLFTGKNPSNTGFLGYIDKINWNYENMLPQVLRDNGYQTHCVGKTHFYPQRKHCGFEGVESYEACQKLDENYVNDYYEWLHEKTNGNLHEIDNGLDDNTWNARPSILPEEFHNNSWVVTKGIDFIKRRDKTRPYFLNLSFHRPHPPLDPPLSFWSMYMDKKLEDIPIGDWAKNYEKNIQSCVNGVGEGCWSGKLSYERLKRARLAYYAQISHIDSQIGRFMNYLRRNNEVPDIIIFTSDHGEMLGDHNLFFKTYAYEGSAGIPLIIKTKHCDKNLVRDETVVLQDIYTTILNLASIKTNKDIDGLDLTPLLQKDGTIQREWIHGEHSACYSRDEAMQFMTDGKFKYIWFTNTNKELLFDLTKDPYECRNLSNNLQYDNELLKWRKRMINHLKNRKIDGLSDGDRLITNLVPAYRILNKE